MEQNEPSWKSGESVREGSRTERVLLPLKPNGSAGEVRLAKILRLRAAIASGRYEVSVDEIAESMLRCVHREMAAMEGLYSG